MAEVFKWEDPMTTLPTCPREDCTATCDHTHVLTTGNPYPCFLQVGGSCIGHQSDRNYNTTRCYAPRTPQPQPYRFPDGWERGHEAGYWLQTGLTPYGLTLDPERAPGVLNWLGVNYYTPDSPHLPKPAAVTLPTVEEVLDIIKAGGFYSDTARAVLDFIAARLPVWQPVEPGTTIKAGTRVRDELTTDGEASEWDLSTDITFGDPPDVRRMWLDPRTVPAEPEDPRVELVAEELHSHGGCEEKWPCCSVSTVENYRHDARDILAKLDGFDR